MNHPPFNPNDPGTLDGGIFGLPYSTEEADIVILPVPWDVTTSYRPGTARGPEAILEASRQMDVHDPLLPRAWTVRTAMEAIPADLLALNDQTRPVARRVIDALEAGAAPVPADLDLVNAACDDMTAHIHARAAELLAEERTPVCLGGDHSTPLGLIRAHAESGEPFGILQVDAHADLRHAYEGFTQSHASIFRNVLDLPEVTRLVQVGLRDVCDEEIRFMQEQGERLVPWFDWDLRRRQFRGEMPADLHQAIAESLPERVYLSLDIDGLDPSLCPHTGTPVPGGLGFEETLHLIETVVASGREIIGFDLCEVAPGSGGGDWDANVGARLLFRTLIRMAVSKLSAS